MRLLRTLLWILLSATLMMEPELYAQTKKPTTTTKSTSKSSTPTKPASTKPTSTKPPTTKSTAKPQSKPAAKSTAKQTTTKPTTAKSTTTKPAAKPQAKKPAAKPAAKNQSKSSTPAQPPKKLTRAEYEKQQKELIKQIAATERMISDNDKSVLSQSRDIKLREDEINKRRALLASMQDEIEAIRMEEDSLRRVIGRLRLAYQGKQEKYAAAVKHLYKWRSGYDEWLFVLSAKDVAESMRRIRYLRQYSQWRKQEAHVLAKQRMATESVQEKLVLVRQDREGVMTNLQKERDALARKLEKQEASLKQLKSKQRELKAALVRDQKKQKEVQRMITKLIEEERRKAAAQNKEGGSNSKSGSAFAYSPAEIAQLTGSFRQNKGKMPYPVDSDFSILSHYTKDGNYSITLSSMVGAHACAIFEGTVQRVVKSSEDYTVIISHGDYMSVYSNLSACHVSEGQKVKMRQSIGKIKADIDGHCGELMFWIFGKNEAENPESWLLK